MSAAFTTLVITNQGNAMTAQAWASSGVITITSVQFGSGFPGVSDNIPGYTTLKTPITNGQITGSNIIVAGQCTIRCNLNGLTIPSTFQINEIGVFASFAGGLSKLVAYCSTGAATGDTLTLGTAVVKDYALLVTFNQGVITSVNISLLQTVGLHAVGHLDNGIDPIPLANTARTGLVPKSTNTGVNVLSDTTPISWVPAVIVISVNLTLYVATTGNNATAIPNDPAHPWLTLQGALNYLNRYAIANGVTITIQMAAGSYTGSAVVNHVNGSQINITGATHPDFSFTGISGITGSAGNWNVTVSGFTSTVGISTNMWVIIWYTGDIANLGNGLLTGFFYVTAVTGTTVSFHSSYFGSFWPSLVGFSGGVMTPISTLLVPAQNADGLNIQSQGVGTLSYFGVVPAAAPTAGAIGIRSTGPVNMNRVGASFFTGGDPSGQAGVHLSTGACAATLTAVGVSACSSGLVVAGASCNLAYLASSTNAVYGIWCNGGRISCTGVVFVTGNISTGVVVSLSGLFQVVTNGAAWVGYTNGTGVSLSGFSQTASSTSSCYIIASNNIGFDVSVNGLSINGAYIGGSRLFNQAENVLTANGIIYN